VTPADAVILRVSFVFGPKDLANNRAAVRKMPSCTSVC